MLEQLCALCSWPMCCAVLGRSCFAALVLHFVVTLWHCLVNVLPRHGWRLPPPGQTLHVAYLGEATCLEKKGSEQEAVVACSVRLCSCEAATNKQHW